MSADQQIRDFIVGELQFQGKPEDLTDDYPLLENEVIDSMGIFQIVSFLESDLGVEVDDDELVPDNFATIKSIVGLIAAKK
ncbi:MAG: acyl carrier protein [Acidimicrobiia bacterium]|nr:acyl carrier protein [Acidimicrobiia bacterium]NNF64304.1 acyl carrier protein [Acidimicrobiia bacterium]